MQYKNDTRLNKPQDVRRMLSRIMNELLKNGTLDPIQKAKALGYLSSISLKAMEMSDLEERMADIEKALKEGV